MSWMPFVKHDHKKKMMKTSTLFFEGDLHYEELEEGLWILVSDINFKKNVSYNLIYDTSLPIDYYTLSLYFNETRCIAPSALINNMVNKDKSWMLHKPGDKAINGHFAGSKAVFLMVYFSREWLLKNTQNIDIFTNGKLKNWFESDSQSLYLPEFFHETDKLSDSILKIILNKGTVGVENLLNLRVKTLDLIGAFIKKTREPDTKIQYDILGDSNRRKLLNAEKKLSEAILDGFPGVENLAREVGMSATKLKNDFKTTYGQTLFKYFQRRQMEAARELFLKEPEAKISYVAAIFGYVNPGKFSSAFKKCFGYLPSAIREKVPL